MLNVFISNKIEALSKRLAQEYIADKNPFLKEYIILQTSGMEQWLSVQVAEHTGVFAQFTYSKPNAFIHQLYQWAGIPQHHIYSTENLKWLLFKFLNEDDFINQFPRIAGYYKDNPNKRLMLSVKVADLFDQYLLYRQEYVQNWNQNKAAELINTFNLEPKEKEEKQKRLNQHQAWQQYLWQKVKAFLPDDYLDQTEQKEALLERLEDKSFQDLIRSKVAKVSLFGLSVITEYHIEIFHRLSAWIDVKLYFINPSPETYWYDNISEKFALYIEKKTEKSIAELKLEVGNEFLSYYSKLAKDTFNILFTKDDFVNAIDDHLAIAPPANSLLGKIQNDIYFNRNESEASISIDDLQDKSIQISSSYTLMREVENWYQQLLWYFQNKPDLKPHEVVVYVPQIDLYAPYIKAVFEDNKAQIPYAIADQTYANAHSLFNLAEELLNLDYDNFTPETILYLLSFEAVSGQFHLENMDLIRESIQASNIHFGIEGKQEDETYLVSWTYGLERLLLGYAMKGEPLVNVSGKMLYPTDHIEGQEYEELFRFKHFIDQLILFVKQKTAPRHLKDWVDFIRRFFALFISESHSSVSELRTIEKQLLSMEEMSENIDELIDFDVFKKAFTDALFNNIKSSWFVTGKLTFSSMIPLRSIPFKVIAVLGLNYNDFPRKETKIAFNLIDIEYKRGDRNPKNNDKYLFLELLLSVREHLYLSYIGRSVNDNTEIPPSVVIEDLLQYIEKNTPDEMDSKTVRSYLVQHHPLHSFSSQYNRKGSNLLQYQIKETTSFQEPSLKAISADSELETQNLSRHISLQVLMSFLKNPFKFYFNKTLHIYYQEEDRNIEDTEIFELNALEEYHLKAYFWQHQEADILKLKSENALPLSHYGEFVYEDKKHLIADLKTRITDVFGRAELSQEYLSGEWNGVHWGESISNIQGDKAFRIELGNESGKERHWFNSFVQHLYLIACGQPKTTYTYILYDEKPVVMSADLMSEMDAQYYLRSLHQYLEKGLQQPVLFDFTESFKWLKKYLKGKDKPTDVTKALKILKEQDLDSAFSFYCPYKDKAGEKGFLEPSEENIEQFKTNAIDILKPFVMALGLV